MLSAESKYLKDLLDKKITEFSQTMAFITNKNQSIVAQSISEDFDFNLINHVHKLTAQFNQSFLDMVENDNINYFLMSSYKGLLIIMKHLDLPEFDISKIVCVSQTLSNEKIVDLAFQFGIKIEKIETDY
jgi:hydrogenase maturation factor HypE